MQKLFVTLFFLSLSTEIFSEEYLCSINLSQLGQTGQEIKTYKRMGGVFLKTSRFGEGIFQIAKETEEFIILNKTYNYSSIYTVFLNKNNKKLVEDYIVFSEPEDMLRVSGECLIKN